MPVLGTLRRVTGEARPGGGGHTCVGGSAGRICNRGP